MPAIATRNAARMRHLGLAEADVAADEAVHRARGLEVAGSRRRSRAPGRASRRTGTSPRRRGSRRRRRGSAWPGLRLRARRRGAGARRPSCGPPSRRAPWSARTCEPPSRSSFGARVLAARVLLDLVEPLDREVELVAAGVLDGDEIDGEPADVLVDEPLVAADAVLDVHDEVADARGCAGPRGTAASRPAASSASRGGGRARRRSPPR